MSFTVLKAMLKEEWRTQSEMFKGRNLAALPIVIFSLTFLGSLGLVEYTDSAVGDIGMLISAFGFFTGLAAGSIGFSSSDAAKNILGNVNFLIFSSRTLPVTKFRLFSAFLIKDLIFYTGLYLLPISLAVLLVSTSLLVFVGYMFGLFLAGLALSLVFTNLTSRLPSRSSLLSYSNLPAPGLVKKSILDVSRSTGGLFKIMMSLLVLLGLYWYIINYVPLASYLLANPLTSFAVILGMMSISIYNWLNTYDDIDEYLYLPVDVKFVVKSKFRSFNALSIILLTPILLIAHHMYGGDIYLALAITYITAYYTGSVIMYIAGLNPNERILDSVTFVKFMVLINTPIIPLLVLTAFETDISVIIGILASMFVFGKFLELKKLE